MAEDKFFELSINAVKDIEEHAGLN